VENIVFGKLSGITDIWSIKFDRKNFKNGWCILYINRGLSFLPPAMINHNDDSGALGAYESMSDSQNESITPNFYQYKLDVSALYKSYYLGILEIPNYNILELTPNINKNILNQVKLNERPLALNDLYLGLFHSIKPSGIVVIILEGDKEPDVNNLSELIAAEKKMFELMLNEQKLMAQLEFLAQVKSISRITEKLIFNAKELKQIFYLLKDGRYISLGGESGYFFHPFYQGLINNKNGIIHIPKEHILREISFEKAMKLELCNPIKDPSYAALIEGQQVCYDGKKSDVEWYVEQLSALKHFLIPRF